MASRYIERQDTFDISNNGLVPKPTAQDIADGKVLGAGGSWVTGGGGGSSYVEVSGTLSAGASSVILSDPAISTTGTFDFYTEIYGLSPSSVSVSAGAITLYFEPQASNVGVKVRVS